MLLLYRMDIALWFWWIIWPLFAFLVGILFPAAKLSPILRGRRPGHELILEREKILKIFRSESDGLIPVMVTYQTCETGYRKIVAVVLDFVLRIWRTHRFHQNYMEAWKQRYEVEQRLGIPSPENPTFVQTANSQRECSVMQFRDNGSPLLIPCRWDMSDQQLIRHVRNIYYLQRLENGFLPVFSLKTINFVEVVKLEQRLAVDVHQSYISLGRYGSINRLIRFWRNPCALSGTTMVEKLTNDGVLALPTTNAVYAQAPLIIFTLLASQQQIMAYITAQNQPLGDHQMALNVVSRWNTGAAGTVVAVPLVVSSLFGIVWPAVSVAVFGADVNTSVQTGFPTASYVITAGAILIPLVAFLDTQNEKVKGP